jgi:hypothetical protein
VTMIWRICMRERGRYTNIETAMHIGKEFWDVTR